MGSNTGTLSGSTLTRSSTEVRTSCSPPSSPTAAAITTIRVPPAAEATCTWSNSAGAWCVCVRVRVCVFWCFRFTATRFIYSDRRENSQHQIFYHATEPVHRAAAAAAAGRAAAAVAASTAHVMAIVTVIHRCRLAGRCCAPQRLISRRASGWSSMPTSPTRGRTSTWRSARRRVWRGS